MTEIFSYCYLLWEGHLFFHPQTKPIPPSAKHHPIGPTAYWPNGRGDQCFGGGFSKSSLSPPNPPLLIGIDFSLCAGISLFDMHLLDLDGYCPDFSVYKPGFKKHKAKLALAVA
jgi:hypothetical protein